MKKFGSLIVGCLLMAACDTSTPTEPRAVSHLGPTFSTSASPQGGDFEIDWSTYQHTQHGYDETARFRDTEGNWYFLQLSYDPHWRLADFRAYINGTLVGVNNPVWNGAELIRHYAHSPGYPNAEYWASVSDDGEHLINFGYDGPGGGSGSPHCPPEGCAATSAPEAGAVYGYAPLLPPELQAYCRDRFIDYGWSSAGMVFTFGGLGGAVMASPYAGPGGPWLVGFAAYSLARATRDWYQSMRALDQCVRMAGGAAQ